jgi:type IV secretory pathway protease TraF
VLAGWPPRPRCAGLGGLRAPLPRLTYNPSDSVAVGWYRIDPFDPRTASLPRPLSVDSIVLVPLPATAAALAAQRGYLPTRVPLLKRVGAVAPQHVCIVAGRYASTACLRPPCCLPTGWAGRCHPCSFAAALNRANCSC